jgi:hypothetical protein
MNELRIDSFGRRRVSPFDGSSRLVVVPDVTKDFSAEIVDGGEDASGNELPLDFGEPDFDLVKPRRIGGGKMNADVGMTGQEIVDELGFVSREIVRDDVDLASEGLGSHDLGKKVDELGAGMALGGLAKDFSAVGIQGRVKRKGAVAIILKAMSLGSTRGKRQDRIVWRGLVARHQGRKVRLMVRDRTRRLSSLRSGGLITTLLFFTH